VEKGECGSERILSRKLKQRVNLPLRCWGISAHWALAQRRGDEINPIETIERPGAQKVIEGKPHAEKAIEGKTRRRESDSEKPVAPNI
jgi:hypothetical protein